MMGLLRIFYKTFNLKTAIWYMAKGWEEVKSSTLKKAWRKIWPSVMLIDSNEEEDFAKKELMKELLEYVKGAISPEVKETLKSDTIEEELETWLDCDVQAPTTHVLTDEEIIDMVINPDQTDTQNLNESEGDEGSSKVSWDEAQTSLETFISFMESRNEFTTQDVINHYMLHSKFLSYRRAASKQFRDEAGVSSAGADSDSSSLTDPVWSGQGKTLVRNEKIIGRGCLRSNKIKTKQNSSDQCMNDNEPEVYIDVAEHPKDPRKSKHSVGDDEFLSVSDGSEYIKSEDGVGVKIEISQEYFFDEFSREQNIDKNRSEGKKFPSVNDEKTYIKSEYDVDVKTEIPQEYLFIEF
ncbi:uncharacterized protein LOC143036751 [Oratosquilla oratoria]|uniref:uncharacterized protein LOC143036751 n=1 Tax=Oratosquilla oratoria TaxID=337810 RepID=UPI003F762958